MNNQSAAVQDWTLGASRTKRLMLGDLPGLWAEITKRRPEQEPPTAFSLHIAMGEALEPLHVAWFRQQTGILVRQQQSKPRHHTLPLHATLDGVVDVPTEMLGYPGGDLRCFLPWEGKTCRPGLKIIDLVAREHAQLQAQMMVTGAALCVLSVMWRTPKWGAYIVEACLDTQQEIEDRLSLLATHVALDTEPPDIGEAFTQAASFTPLCFAQPET